MVYYKNSRMQQEHVEDEKTLLRRLLSALFYGLCSFMIVVVNKIVLTSYKFPSYQFLGIGQMVATVVVLFIGKHVIRQIHYPDFDKDTVKKVFPLPLIFLVNLVTGLGSTKKLSLPMFTVLRRFTIFCTMVLEYYLLQITPTGKTIFCIFLMLFGAFIAAIDDLAFDALGYAFIFFNDLATASNMVVTKQKLDAKDLGKYGLLYYNSLFMLPPMMLIAWGTGDLSKAWYYDGWLNPLFLSQFLMSCFCGFILMYSIMLSTHYNSALTTTIIGVIKNLLVTYLGMFIGGDYIFTWVNFTGLNISVLGSLIYTYATFTMKPAAAMPKVIEVKADTV